MADSMRTVGTVGALLLLVGAVLLGTGLAVQAWATQTEINCTQARAASCAQTFQSAENITIAGEYVEGSGAIVTGLAGSLVAWSLVTILARRGGDPAIPAPPPRWTPDPSSGRPGEFPPPPPRW